MEQSMNNKKSYNDKEFRKWLKEKYDEYKYQKYLYKIKISECNDCSDIE